MKKSIGVVSILGALLALGLVGCDDDNVSGECKTSFDCETGMKCSDGKCVPKVPESTCEVDMDCVGGRCQEGKCTYDCTEVPTKGSLIINEIMSNPKQDTNCDGQFDSADDEYIEIYNASSVSLNLKDLEITEKDKTKFTFPPMCLPSHRSVVVWGGGAPVCVIGESLALTGTGTPGGTAMKLPEKPVVGLALNGVELTSIDTSGISNSDGYAFVRYPDITGGDVFTSYANVPGIISSDYGTPGACLLKDPFSEIPCSLENVEPTCSDKIRNGNESDVDCGGTACSPCNVGATCVANSDCLTNNCMNSKCAAAGEGCVGVTVTKGDFLINEIFTRDKAETSFDGIPGIPQNDFIEFVNVSENDINLKGVQLFVHKKHPLDKPDELDWAQKEELHAFKDSACIKAGSGLVLYASNNFAYSNKTDVLELKMDKTSLLKMDELGITATLGSEELFRMEIKKGEGASETQVSLQRNPDFSGGEDSFSDHNIVNNGGLKHSPARCASGDPLSVGCSSISTCSNGKLDEGELDVDCGNTCAAKCGDGKKCTADADCLSNKCKPEGICDVFTCTEDKQCGTDATCLEGACVSCSDGVKNGAETDIDCGGNCAGCGGDKKCNANSDCESGICKNNACFESTAPLAQPSDIFVNELLDSGSESPAFALNEGVKACEFIELVNSTNKALNLSGLDLILDGYKDTPQKIKTISLSGELQAKNVLVVHNCPTLPLPSDARDIFVNDSGIFTGTWTYDISLQRDDIKVTQVTGLSIKSEKKSSFNRNPDMDATASFEKSAAINAAAPATPGYCANGGLYSEGCADSCSNNQKDDEETDVDCGGMCKACAPGKKCAQNSDCENNDCSNGICSTKVVESATIDNILINEVLGAPKSSDKFTTLANTGQREFIEIVNLTNKELSLSGISLKFMKENDESSLKTIDLVGTIAPKGAHLVFEKKDGAIENLPDGVSHQVYSSANIITNSSPYSFYLSDGTQNSPSVATTDHASAISQTRATDKDKNSPLVPHNDQSLGTEHTNSPGYCSNGKLFTNDCQ